MNKVIPMTPPPSLAIFHKIDVDPGFAVMLCTDASLQATINVALYASTEAPDADCRAEAAEVMAELRQNGDVTWEDGWISLRVGLADVTSFVMEKMKEAREEERWADRQRYEELKKREDAETRYALLRQALADALGDKAAEIAKVAA